MQKVTPELLEIFMNEAVSNNQISNKIVMSFLCPTCFDKNIHSEATIIRGGKFWCRECGTLYDNYQSALNIWKKTKGK